MTEPFKDHFSGVSQEYAQFRPRYPAALFDFLAGVAPGRNLAWDCAAGSGQATIDLAARFARVVATDASARQLDAAPRHPRVSYRVAPAEASGLPDACADLIAVAQAFHWFDQQAFFREARRVLVESGVLAIWTYAFMRFPDDPALDAAEARFYGEVLKGFWPPERALVDEGYAGIAFPFAEIAAPPLFIEERWSLPRLLGYVGTWSAVSRYRKARGSDPLLILAESLAPHWGPPEREHRMVWPLTLRLGRRMA